MGKRQAGVDWMKRKIVLGYMLAAGMVLVSCQGKESGLDVTAGGGQQTEQSLKPGQEGWEDGTGHAGKNADQSQGSDRNIDQSQGSDRNIDQSQGSGRNIDQSRDNDQQAGQGQPGSRESDSGQGRPITQNQYVISKAARNLGTDNTIFTGTFFQAGDIRRRIFLRPAKGGMETEWLECSFLIQDYADAFSVMDSTEFLTEEGRLSYEVQPQEYLAGAETEAGNPSYTVTFHLTPDLTDRHISVEGNGAFAGDYYPWEGSFTFPDVFTRNLCKADLCLWPTEDLMLLRNEIYAAHGRKFKSDVLNQYYSGKMWYRGIMEPDAFSESLLSDVEKNNIAFIKEMEGNPDRNRLDGQNQYGLEDLPFAPYLSLLGNHPETGLYADLSTARDMGAYYVVQGSISIPAAITAEQVKLMADGGEVQVVLNERTGEHRMLALDPGTKGQETAYGYVLYEEGGNPSGSGEETGLTLDYGSGTYELWQTSADTVMKTIYEGDIYILKGAVEGSYTGVAMASRSQQEILPSDRGQGMDGVQDMLGGNCLSYNQRGHFTAVYSLGD